MPGDTDPGMAFVLVQHLAPDHKSILAQDEHERAIGIVLSGTGSDAGNQGGVPGFGDATKGLP